ncbi:MAG: di-trans,poly-cis-decaprenylcistransferase [Nanoarchaeota archaeon]|nr:di-trans,poly-cis-decaprenylcistransferase [Nanoarchaeota archaeon]
MLDRLRELRLDKGKLPKHIGIVIGGNQLWAEEESVEKDVAFRKSFTHLMDSLDMCIQLNIPILTVHLLSEKMRDSPEFPDFMNTLIEFLDKLHDSKMIHTNQVKISIFGKWYKLPDRMVNSIKSVLNKTAGYDKLFLNLCINYDGQDEIVDACRLIGKQISMGRIDPDLVNRQTIKENLYTASFLPVGLLIVTGPYKSNEGFLLWDTKHAAIYFAKKNWLEFQRQDFFEALRFHQRA